MKETQQLHDAGQSLWFDNISRALLNSGGGQRWQLRGRTAGL
jgi:hypothetical protein